MLNRFFYIGLCSISVSACSVFSGSSGISQDQAQRETAIEAWFDSALDADEIPATDEFNKPLNLAEAEELLPVVWNAYRQSAKGKGWDKRLLSTPPTFKELAKLPKEKRKIESSTLASGDKLKMPYVFLAKGKKPEKGWPLFISMHGGGKYFGKEPLEGPHGWNVNTREWQAQMSLTQRVYEPAGLYFLPRMADDRMGRWFHKHNIDIFQRMIRLAILFNDVDPNRVYIMGISQGGYGSCHLAPFMADHFAAAAPMAGGMATVVENLRNLPFRSDIGEGDTAYNRIKLATELHASLDRLQKDDPHGYENIFAIQKGKGHGIDYRPGPKWLAEHSRNPHPDRIVWRCHAKDGVYRDHFYWLSLSKVPQAGEYEIVATANRKTNVVNVIAEEIVPAKQEEGEEKKSPTRKPLESSQITVRLNDSLVDLDRAVTITLNDKQVFHGKLERRLGEILKNIVTRGDINYAFTASIELHRKNTP